MNPGCDLPQCKTPDQPAIFYANHYVGDDTIHILYSSLDELTISIIQTKKGYGPHINYTALFNRNYRDSISFGDTTPINSLSLILRRLLRFNDINDTGYLNPNDTTIQSYWLNDLSTNITYRDNNTDQPSFQLLLKEKDINGLLTIDINYPGESIRDTKFPKLRSTPKSYFLNIALKADNYTSPKTRFAMEYYIIQLGVEGTQLSTSKYIDDQYTPGIFNVWRVESLSPIYLSSMLWKPVVYQSDDRSIEKNTLMNVYNLSNKINLQPLVDQGIFIALYKKPYVSGFNVSFGRANDGFFTKSNYTFIQFTAGLEILQTDSIKQFVTLALLLSLAIPCLVAVIAFIFIMKRRCTRQNTTSYDIIDD
ncbi:unnamed protein product [Adineta steineri]|uniref:Lysosomal protein NCU-G1 n=1 Tax=Adineta steineri TaxID=433720 RepID=A0A814HX17_9BILA|nr:unnamed protein product [Adineta steineri]CAF1200548.1 unnamed protein product [Adineta steineri]CAF1255443.1 unnamed protein product [Adineta steineri]